MRPYQICLTVLSMAVVAALPQQASAQDMSTRLQKPIVSGTGKTVTTRGAPPPGLPGAAINKDRASPSDKVVSDLPPTDALFDAINRGDIASARDSLSRGADFNARNVLGLTPLDQSIDLARNDITFLLLSLRGSQPLAEPAELATPKGKPVKVAGPQPERRPAAERPAPVAPRAQTVARSTDRGLPDPGRGFLGFGG